MHIKFLGTGGAFDYEYGNSSAIITFRGKRILVDCGNTVYSQIRKKNLADTIDYVLITHLHDDHVGSLCTFLLHQYYFLNPPVKAKILFPTPEFKNHLYNFISFGLPVPDDFVNFVHISEFEGLDAIETSGLHISNMLSYAYFFENEQEIIAYSGDLGEPNLIFDFLRNKPDKYVRVFHEMSFEQVDGVHVYYKDLMHWQKKFDIYAYHLDPRSEPEDNTIPLVANRPDLLF